MNKGRRLKDREYINPLPFHLYPLPLTLKNETIPRTTTARNR